jgi:hypothetical protein
MLKWFDTRDVDGAADRIASDLIQRLPPTSITDAQGKGDKKQNKASEQALMQARDFAGGQRLNFYQKARLANRFKWTLIEAGYPRQFVDALSDELAAQVTAAQADAVRK